MDNYLSERILILADSSGIGIREDLLKITPLNFHVIVRKGSQTREIVARAWPEVSGYKPTQVYIVTGICSVTSLNAHSNTISPRYADTREAIQLYESDMQLAEQQVNQAVYHHKPRTVFAPIIGVDIAKFNKRTIITDHLRVQNNS